MVRENLASIYFPEENQLLGIATSSEATINILNDSLNMVSADVGSYPTTIVYDTPLVSCGTSGSAQQTASVTLLPATQTIMSGNSATLTWNGTNVSSCSATSPAGWMSSTAIAGSKSVSPTASATTTLTYSLTCTSKVGGTNPSASATVTITPKH